MSTAIQWTDVRTTDSRSGENITRSIRPGARPVAAPGGAIREAESVFLLKVLAAGTSTLVLVLPVSSAPAARRRARKLSRAGRRAYIQHGTAIIGIWRDGVKVRRDRAEQRRMQAAWHRRLRQERYALGLTARGTVPVKNWRRAGRQEGGL